MRRKFYSLALTAVEPEGSRGVVDRDLPDGELGSVGGNELVARIDTGHGAAGIGDVRAGVGERGLGDGVVQVQELELKDITIGDTGDSGKGDKRKSWIFREKDALLRVKLEGLVPSNLDDVGSLGESNTNGQESGGNSGETHLELDRERGSKERA